MSAFKRVKSLIGEENLNILMTSSIAIFGVGGVGGFVAEALVRSGIGKIAVIDNDVVDVTNINRQIIATFDTLGKSKVEAIKKRLLSINKDLQIETYNLFYLPENAHEIDLTQFDYIVDAVDTVSAKIELIVRAKSINKPIISCMGTGGKLEMDKLKVADLKQTKGCPLARVMRRELKKRNVESLKVVYSEESVTRKEQMADEGKGVKIAPPSMIFVPAVAGLYIAKEVVMDLIKNKRK